MSKIDFRKTVDSYRATKTIELIDVPPMTFVMVDGSGNPNTAPAYQTAIEWLYSTSYALKFASKAALGQDYVVPPLEGLWWADDPADFVARRKDNWRWTMMIMAPDFLTQTMFEQAVAKSAGKLGERPQTLRLETLNEGACLQVLHIGSYDDEGPTLAQLHDVEMPARNLAFNGHHHEIYLSDARRTAPAKLKTILRQPVRRD
ncbi:GyrI-like domain-containing protein [Devosia lacusdianchii]|uniref:GyrI-like domain-containing protein n=1 Tax=Devosia lacusdianchii TaxID=2917991 RepID=UPI001F06A055|nr:GyrI-like domain-containing protein [Devosia sp. JXJ CY 41]